MSVTRSGLPTHYLFRGPYFENHLQARLEAMRREVDTFPKDYLLNASESDLISGLRSKYEIEMVELHPDKMEALEPRETERNVSNEAGRYFSTPGDFYVKADVLTFVIPFSGDDVIFGFIPDGIFPTNHVYGHNAGRELHFEYTATNMQEETASVRSELNVDLARIRDYLSRVATQVEQFNVNLEGAVTGAVQGRKQRILQAANSLASFEIPVRRRDSPSGTYAVPIERKRIVVALPEVPAGVAFKPEPTLPKEYYDEILARCEGMALVMERNPSSFASMDEETLRDQFLVPLNSDFGMEATGETFNRSGKTDILIRHQKSNLFIAECKFWNGPASMKKAIDQLLSYATWRDTKTALLVFNKGGNLTDVIRKADETIRDHDHFKRFEATRSETHHRYVFNLPEDKNREIHVALLIFNIPTE